MPDGLLVFVIEFRDDAVQFLGHIMTIIALRLTSTDPGGHDFC
jgi:hypothetical protein